jgi:hypothetical protein
MTFRGFSDKTHNTTLFYINIHIAPLVLLYLLTNHVKQTPNIVLEFSPLFLCAGNVNVCRFSCLRVSGGKIPFDIAPLHVAT